MQGMSLEEAVGPLQQQVSLATAKDMHAILRLIPRLSNLFWHAKLEWMLTNNSRVAALAVDLPVERLLKSKDPCFCEGCFARVSKMLLHQNKGQTCKSGSK